MEITLTGQTGLSAAERAAEASKRGRANVSTPVPCTAERTVRRLGLHLRKFIAIHNPVQVRQGVFANGTIIELGFCKNLDTFAIQGK